MLGTSMDRADEVELQIKDLVVKNIISGRVVISQDKIVQQVEFDNYNKTEHEKAAKQKLIDQAVYLRA